MSVFIVLLEIVIIFKNNLFKAYEIFFINIYLSILYMKSNIFNNLFHYITVQNELELIEHTLRSDNTYQDKELLYE